MFSILFQQVFPHSYVYVIALYDQMVLSYTYKIDLLLYVVSQYYHCFGLVGEIN